MRSVMSVAAVGDSSFVAAFEFSGAYGFVAEKEEEVKETLKTLVNDDEMFKIIILSERFTLATLEIRMKIAKEGRVCPIFAIVPDMKEEGKGERAKEIKSRIGLALGVELK